jgi:DNA polymerase III delta prime subunit
MLFYGPPGTGKTSTILALAKELFGPELYRSRVLELNASDERGINVVREKIKDFARAQLSTVPAPKTTSTTVANNTNNSTRSRRHPCPPFKLIVLDEADSMTQDAQAALRRTMETYSRLTRFCLVCNYVTRIIDPLASRCSKFRFKSLDRGSARARLAEIAAAERVPLGRNGDDGDGAGAVLDTLIRCSDGDLRKAITFLQSAARLVGAVKPQQRSGSGGGGGNEGSGDTAGGGGGGGSTAAKGKRSVIQDPDAMDVDEQQVSPQMPAVTVKIVEEIAGVIPTEIIEALVQAMRPRAKGTVYEAISSIVTDMVADGWSGTQVVSQVKFHWSFFSLFPLPQFYSPFVPYFTFCLFPPLTTAGKWRTHVDSIYDSYTKRSSSASLYPTSRRTGSCSSSPRSTSGSSTALTSTCRSLTWRCVYRISLQAHETPYTIQQ